MLFNISNKNLKTEKQINDLVGKPFSLIEFNLQKNDIIYIFTDGFQDQFGGPKGKKFKYKKFKSTLIEISELEMEVQKNKLLEIHNAWRRNLEQVDDILVLGIKI